MKKILFYGLIAAILLVMFVSVLETVINRNADKNLILMRQQHCKVIGYDQQIRVFSCDDGFRRGILQEKADLLPEKK